MEKILVTYTSRSGSTREIAEFIGADLAALGAQVDVLPIREVADIAPYGTVIAGGLLYRFGWHPEVARFVQVNQAVLKHKPTAIFVTGLRLIKTAEIDGLPFPVFLDPQMAKEPTNPGKLTWLDSLSTCSRYLGSALASITEIRPLSLAFFAGKLDLKTLNLPEKLIMRMLMLLTDVKQGDHRNWDAIRAWSGGLYRTLPR
jgi:menaquinone-dependent protoporphyrinogen IX oxidase